jgi:hypothetical protein
MLDSPIRFSRTLGLVFKEITTMPDRRSPDALHGILRSTLHLIEHYRDRGSDVPSLSLLVDSLRATLSELETLYKFEPLSDFEAIRRETDSKWFRDRVSADKKQ